MNKTNATNMALNGTHRAQKRRAFPLRISYLTTSNGKHSGVCAHFACCVWQYSQTFLCTLCLFEAFCCKRIRGLIFANAELFTTAQQKQQGEQLLVLPFNISPSALFFPQLSSSLDLAKKICSVTIYLTSIFSKFMLINLSNYPHAERGNTFSGKKRY